MSRKGKIQTVRNVIDPIDLGMTMTHEHLLIEFPDTFSVPPEESHRKSISSWIAHNGLTSIMPDPLDIDVEKRPWPIPNQIRFLIKGIVCINMIHISPWSCTKALFEESKKILKGNYFLMLYGPFFRIDKETSESNLVFDQSLKSQNLLWGIRQLERVDEIAFEHGFEQEKIFEMPANNLSVIYRLNS